MRAQLPARHLVYAGHKARGDATTAAASHGNKARTTEIASMFHRARLAHNGIGAYVDAGTDVAAGTFRIMEGDAGVPFARQPAVRGHMRRWGLFKLCRRVLHSGGSLWCMRAFRLRGATHLGHATSVGFHTSVLNATRVPRRVALNVRACRLLVPPQFPSTCQSHHVHGIPHMRSEAIRHSSVFTRECRSRVSCPRGHGLLQGLVGKCLRMACYACLPHLPCACA